MKPSSPEPGLSTWQRSDGGMLRLPDGADPAPTLWPVRVLVLGVRRKTHRHPRAARWFPPIPIPRQRMGHRGIASCRERARQRGTPPRPVPPASHRVESPGWECHWSVPHTPLVHRPRSTGKGSVLSGLEHRTPTVVGWNASRVSSSLHSDPGPTGPAPEPLLAPPPPETEYPTSVARLPGRSERTTLHP